MVVTVMPGSLIDEDLLKVAGGAKKHKPAATFGGTRLKKCHWQGTSKLRLHRIDSHPFIPNTLIDVFSPGIALRSSGCAWEYSKSIRGWILCSCLSLRVNV